MTSITPIVTKRNKRLEIKMLQKAFRGELKKVIFISIVLIREASKNENNDSEKSKDVRTRAFLLAKLVTSSKLQTIRSGVP